MQALGAISALPGKMKPKQWIDNTALHMPSALWVLFYIYNLSLTKYRYVAYDYNYKLTFISKA